MSALDPDAVLWADAVRKNGGTISPDRLAKISDFIKAEKAYEGWELTDDYLIGGEVTLKKRKVIKIGKKHRPSKRGRPA